MAEHDTSPDADLHLKKRARRRLVGAVALALLAVIVLPMVMDREPRPLSQDIQVRIPSQDSTGFTAKVLQGKAAVTPMPAPEAKAAPDVKSVPETAVEPKIQAKAKPEPAVAIPATATSVASAAKAASSPPAAPAAKPATPDKVTAVTEKAVSETSGQWVVQLGAYKESGNVNLLLAKLKGIGVPAYTEKFDSPQGLRTRVRAGPFASQAAAEKARSKIKIVGVDGPVAQK